MPDKIGVSMLRRLTYLAVAILVLAGLVILGLTAWSGLGRQTKPPAGPQSAATLPGSVGKLPRTAVPEDDEAPTLMYAHNLELRKGPNFRVYIRWLRGSMLRTSQERIPTFDDPESFLLDIQKGVVEAKIADFSKYMSTVSPEGAPLQKISVLAGGGHVPGQLKIRGTLHKGVPIPVEVQGTLSPASNSLVMFHVSKISAMKVPVKGLLGAFHVSLADLMPTTGIAGVRVAGNDLVFDMRVLMPPPHLHGEISAIVTDATTIKLIYGGAHDDENKLARWHNFLQLTGGTLSFGKVTMHQADLTLIDASNGQWFYLDLVNYQAQLTNGYALMTPQAGLQVFMPDLDPNRPGKVKGPVTMELLRDRDKPIPGGVGK